MMSQTSKRELLAAGGVPSPVFTSWHVDSDARVAAARATYPCVLKPLVLSASRGVIRADDLMPSKDWRVLASVGYMCDDPYTGAPGVKKVSEGVYQVTTRLATHHASALIRFTFRLMKTLEETRHVFSPLLVRFLSGVDHTRRTVKISDSGRIRNELQTMLSQALEYDGDRMRIHFDRVDEKVMPREKQAAIRKVLEWYQARHPVWFEWLEIR